MLLLNLSAVDTFYFNFILNFVNSFNAAFARPSVKTKLLHTGLQCDRDMKYFLTSHQISVSFLTLTVLLQFYTEVRYMGGSLFRS